MQFFHWELYNAGAGVVQWMHRKRLTDGKGFVVFMKQKMIAMCAVLALVLTACATDAGGEAPAPEPAVPDVPPEVVVQPEPEPEPEYDGPVNPLTGLPLAQEYVNDRPIAVMLNNLKQALPQQGNGQADIIYEVLAEGGITRMLGVYQSVEGVGEIGSVRSSRPYYLELALGHDAIYLHAGGSEEAYSKIKEWNVTALDCVRGPYEGSLYWRDKDRIKNNGWEHSVLTSGQTILELFPTYTFRKEHREDFSCQMQFAKDGTPVDGQAAQSIEVPFSKYKTGVFTYDAQSGKYLVEEFGAAYVDGNTGEQVSVTNVLILKTACKPIPGDDADRITVDLTGQGEGWFACGGKILPICWSKQDHNAPLVYTTQSGVPLTLGVGNSYVNIIPTENQITVK